MTARVLIAEPDRFCEEAQAILRRRAEVDLRPTDAAAFAQAFDAYDVVWFRLAHRITGDLVRSARRCRIIATPVTGIDHIDLDACRDEGVRVVCLKGEVEFLRTVTATAELTIGALLALLRKIPQAAAHVVAGGWNRDLFQGGELFGKTVGIVGLGRLGQMIAPLYRAFGMRVLAYDPREDFATDVAERVTSLAALFAQSDVISVHAVYDTSTRHLIGAEAFSALKPGAVMVNTARGGLVDEAALLAALREGRLAGAALDVLEGEPDIDLNHAVVHAAQSMDNLLVLPHIGGNTRESFVKTEVFLAGRVVAALDELQPESRP